MFIVALFVVIAATVSLYYGLGRIAACFSPHREWRWGAWALLSGLLLALSYLLYFARMPEHTEEAIFLNGLLGFYTLCTVVFSIMTVYSLVWRFIQRFFSQG